MKLKLFISTLRPRVGGDVYAGGVRTAVHFTNRDALLDLCEWAYEDDEHVPEEDEAEGIPDFATAPEDELEAYLERRQDEDCMRSWGIDDFEIDLPGTAAEQIAAILKDACAKGDELHAEEILREARGQFIRESDASAGLLRLRYSHRLYEVLNNTDLAFHVNDDLTVVTIDTDATEATLASLRESVDVDVVLDTREQMEEAIAHYTVVCKLTTEELAKKIEGLTGVQVGPEAEDLLATLTDEQVAEVAKACEVQL